MDPDVQSFAYVATIIVGLVGALAFIGIASYKVITSGKGGATKQVEHRDDERMERLQQSVDAIAIEVERIAEAQRFSAKLMTERNEKSRLNS